MIVAGLGSGDSLVSRGKRPWACPYSLKEWALLIIPFAIFFLRCGIGICIFSGTELVRRLDNSQHEMLIAVQQLWKYHSNTPFFHPLSTVAPREIYRIVHWKICHNMWR